MRRRARPPGPPRRWRSTQPGTRRPDAAFATASGLVDGSLAKAAAELLDVRTLVLETHRRFYADPARRLAAFRNDISSWLTWGCAERKSRRISVIFAASIKKPSCP